MANQIIVTPEVLRNRAATIKTFKSQQEDVMSRMNNLMGTLGESWHGDAQDALLLKYLNMQPKVKSFQNSIMEFATLAEETATNFESVDNSIAAKISSITGSYKVGISNTIAESKCKVVQIQERIKAEEAKAKAEAEAKARAVAEAKARAVAEAKARAEAKAAAQARAAEQARQSTSVQNSLPTPTGKTYGSPAGNANAYGMKYYGQGTYAQGYTTENFKASNGKQYTAKSSCAICAEAMILSYYGYDVKPGDLIDANKGSKAWDASGVKNKMKEYGVTMKIMAQKSKGATQAQIQSALDKELEKFAADPAHNGPIMVSTNLASGTHFVLVVGKTNDGKYVIVDPGQGPGGRQTTTIDHIKMVVHTAKS